jgi:POT family proton-dependent oligopeptide transporter
MRALLVLFLTSSLAKGGWSWSIEDAMALYGTYYVGLFHSRNWDSGSLLRVSLGCCARCFGNDFGPRIDGSRNAFVLYIELGFLL